MREFLHIEMKNGLLKQFAKKSISALVIFSSASLCFAHQWYTFSSGNFEPVEKILDVKKLPVKPWTEAVRISSFGVTGSETTGPQTGYFVVNRCGVLSITGNEISLIKDRALFENRTAGNLVFSDNTPVFSFYRSTFFNKDAEEKNRPFLVQYDAKTGISYPILNCENLIPNAGSEVTDFVWDGENWLCSVKSTSKDDGKTVFDYINWKPEIPLLSLSPVTASHSLNISQVSADTFRDAKRQISFSHAPERIRQLLNGQAASTSFILTLYTSGGASPRVFIANENESTPLNAWGIISKSWSAVLFQDGTLYLEGALDGRRIIRGGKPVAMRLPKLPTDFAYTGFVISGTTLYASWEETDFYQTGRSGFLKVDLDETLLSKVK